MCRVAVRQAPRSGGEALYEDASGFAAAVSFEDLFSGEGALDLDDSDLDLLKMFNSASADPVSAEASASAVPAVSASPENTTTKAATVGQAVEAGAASYSAGGMDAVQQLQMQAMLQQQAAITAAGSSSLYQQALVQQMLVAKGSFGAPASSAGMPSTHVMGPAAVASMQVAAPVHHGKRPKTQEEIEEQIERTKKRRRESAQRSRQRKNCYMRSLEIENEALKQEVERLRAELTRHAAVGSTFAAAEGCRSNSSSKGGPAAAAAAAVPFIAVGQPPLGPAATGVPVAAPASDLPVGFCAAGERGFDEAMASDLLGFAL